MSRTPGSRRAAASSWDFRTAWSRGGRFTMAVMQARQARVDAVLRLAEDLGRHVGPRHVAADPASCAVVAAQDDGVRHRQHRRVRRELAVGQRPVARAGDGPAAIGVEGGDVHVPAARRGGQQHLPGPGSRLPDRQPARRHAPAFARDLGGILEQRVHRRDLRGDLAGVDVELLGEQGDVAGGHALPHLDLVDLQDDGAVGSYLQPGIGVEPRGAGHERRVGRVRPQPAEHEPAAGQRGGACQQFAPGNYQGIGLPSTLTGTPLSWGVSSATSL